VAPKGDNIQYPKKQKDGNWIRKIVFNFPVPVNGQEITELPLENETMVETCVLLTHKKPTSYIEVTMDYDKIVQNQKPRHITYKMITEYVKEKYDLVVKSTTIAEVKRSFGLEVGDYNVKDEKTNYRKEKITPEKRQAVEDGLRHFGVIE
jgi:site-specific DNA recombinase